MTLSNFRAPKYLFATLIALMAGSPVFAQSTITAVARTSPAAPAPADMVTVNIWLIGADLDVSDYGGSTLSYSLDGSISGTATISDQNAVAIALGQLSAGRHVLAYTFPGNLVASAASFSFSFQVSNTPFTYLGSSVMVLYNAGDEGHAAVDSRDNVYFSDRSQNVIHKRDTHGNLTTYPTTGLNSPQGVAFDSADNLYIADQGNSRVVKVTPSGVQTTLPFPTTGPLNLAFDNARQNLYITDQPAQTILVFNLATSAMTVFATNQYNVFGVAFDPAGNLYYSQRYSTNPGTLTKVTMPTGIRTAIPTPVNSPGGLVFDKAGTLYFTDFGSGGTWMMTPNGTFRQLTQLGDEALAMDSRGVIYIPLPGNSYTYSRQPAAYTGQSIAFPAGGGFAAGGTDVAQASPTVYYTSSSTEWLSSLTFPTPSSPYRTYAGVTCVGDRFCYEPFVNSFVHPGSQSDYVVATSNLGTQLNNPVYGTGINSELAFNPGNVSQNQIFGGPFGGFAFLPNGDVLITELGVNGWFFSSTARGFETVYGIVNLQAPTEAPTQVAADAQRNVYFLEPGTSRILRGSGGLGDDSVPPNPASSPTVVFDLSTQTGLHTLTAFALDTATNLWIGGADANGNGTILLQDPLGNRKVFASGIDVPAALTVDAFGVLYSVDAGGTLRTFDAVGNPTTRASNLLTPLSIAVEPSGVVYVANGTGDLVEVRPDGSQTTVPIAGVTTAAFVTFDNTGNLAVGDNKTGQIFVVDRSHSQGYAFGNVAVNTVSPVFHSQLLNVGNQSLGFSGFPGDATFASAVTAATCTAATVLAPGGVCEQDYTFKPAAVRAYAETGYISDSTGGASAASSQFALSFTGAGVVSTPPVVTVPANITAEATSANGAVITFMATASDAVDGTDPVTCLPASGSAFAIGTTTVTCTATDRAGNSASQGFSVGVRDTKAPTLTVPGNMTVAATGANGAAVDFVTSAADVVDGTDSVTCLPASGSVFGLGTTTVSCSATDRSGNSASKTFTVTVQDNAPPVLTVPANITAAATSAIGAAVTFTASATDAVDGARPVTCMPASGSAFAIGTTTVTCSATDLSGNTATGTFSVTVTPSTTLITLQENLPVGISVDGGPFQTPGFGVAGLTATLTPGTHTIAVPQTVPWLNQSDVRLNFVRWSDGGAASHSITVGASPATYVATFNIQYLLTTLASPAAGGSVTASQFLDAITNISVTAAANPGFVFAGFSGGLTGSVNPQVRLMDGPTTVVANFTALAPNLAATVGTRTDVVAGVSRQVVLNLSNTGLGMATHATITSVSATVVLGGGAVSVASGLPVDIGTIAPGAAGATAVLFNWPTTATKVKLTVTFTADSGYTGSSSITTLR